VSAAAPLLLDGSESVDLDNPSRSVTHTWTCVQQIPVYGASCNITSDATSSYFFISKLELVALQGSTVLISLIVQNSDGMTDSTSLKLLVLSKKAPTIEISSSKHTYNVNDRMLLTANVSQNLQQVNLKWSCNYVDMNSSFVKTPISVFNIIFVRY